ncbi:MAG: lipocalin family protein [Bacteroidales bacterium]|nr:lipocalin family protein [Bacteroidales bacterium]
MKKTKIFVVIAFIAATAMMMLTSCSKEKRIEGKWKITRVSIISTSSSDSEEVEWLKGAKDECWTFKANGTGFFVIASDYQLDGDWSISGDNLTITTEKDSYGIKNTGDFTIEELNGKVLSINGKWKDTDGWNAKVSYEFEKR